MSFAASAASMPNAWAAAEAVTRDLAHFVEGPLDVLADDVAWSWKELGDGMIAVGMSGSVSFAVGAGHRLDAGAAEATVRLADAVQTELAGYHFTLWPVDETVGRAVRTLTPELRDGAAVWVTRDGRVHAQIGGLGG